MATKTPSDFLQASDITGITFWLISMAVLGMAVFLFLERKATKNFWRKPITLLFVVSCISFAHYLYLRQSWVSTGSAPVLFRYIDWFLTAPILIAQFYFILSSTKRTSAAILWRLVGGTFVMFFGQFLGESGYININPAFIIGMSGWIFVLYEIFAGEAGKEASRLSGDSATCYMLCKWIVTVGWAVYPLGYLLANMAGSTAEDSINIIYNLSDFVNKILFSFIVYKTAEI
jgi:bacteriorhodopsin